MTNKQRVADLSAQGYSPKEISKMTGILYGAIWSWKDEIALNFTGSGGLNRLINKNPFEVWDEKAQYWFGYLVGDGNLSTKKYSISIVSQDLAHLKKYQDWLGLDKMHISAGGKSPKGAVMFGHKQTYDWLVTKGVTPKKSLTVELINVSITNHVLRGLFDADGCARKNRNRSKITSGSIKLLEQFKLFLFLNGIKAGIHLQCGRTYCLVIAGPDDKKFFDFLYQDATVYLERKEERLRQAATRK